MKKYLLYALGLFCLSCTIQYEGDTRLVANGQLLDRNANPIPNLDIEIWAYTDYNGSYGNSSDLISLTKTNNLGEFEMVFPKAKENISYEIKALDNTYTYQNKTVSNIKAFNFVDYTFSSTNLFTLIEIDDIMQLTIILNNVNTENQIIDISIDGILAKNHVYANPIEEPEPYYYGSYYETVAKNQTLIIHYDVRNNNTQTVSSFQEILDVSDEDIYEYTLNY
ncbi:hypothetical protein [Bizionia sp.]|uniref:hypothetical protein n=1 Tax=Bizionia sp. TaxID=1954480 RepID=UPI003A8E08C0